MKKAILIMVMVLWCNVGFAKELKISEDLKKLIEGSIELIEEEKNKGKTKKIQSIFGLTFDLPYHYKPATVLSANQVMEGVELLALKKDINVYRVDINAAFEGLTSTLFYLNDLLKKKSGRKILNGE